MTNTNTNFQIKRFVTFEASEFRNNFYKVITARCKKIDRLIESYARIRKLFKSTNDNYAHGFRNSREKR